MIARESKYFCKLMQNSCKGTQNIHEGMYTLLRENGKLKYCEGIQKLLQGNAKLVRECTKPLQGNVKILSK